MLKYLIIAAMFAVTLSTFTQVARAITVVKDGQPAAAIVIADKAFQAKRYVRTIWAIGKPEEKIRAAAEDLQSYIEKISGAKLPLVSDAAQIDVKASLILVGESALTAKLPLRVPTGVTKDFREEGYTLYCKGNTLALAGNNAENYHGTEYAVFELLNRLGARWYMPGDYGEYLPSLKTITIADVTFRDRPDFAQRLWWQNGTPEMEAANAEFQIRNKMDMNAVLPGAGDATLAQWLPDKDVMAKHPEYFGKNLDGSVNPTMANLTNPDVPALVAEKMKANIKKQLEQGITIPSVPIAPDDGMPVDYTPETAKTSLGFTDLCGRQGAPGEMSVSEEWFRFVNKVAENVAKDYPNALIGTNGYANRNQVPEGVTLNPNLAIEFAAIWCDNLHSSTSPLSWQTNVRGEMMKDWCKINSRVYFYDYDFQMLVSGITPVPGVRKLTVNMPLFKKWGLAGFLDEHRNTYMEEGIQTKYLRARMMWNADLNVKQVMDDYYSHWYGAAAAPAFAFWDDIEACMEQSPMLGHEDRVLPFVYTPELLVKLEKDVADAEAAVNDDRSKAHVHADRLILEHLKAYMAMNDAEFAGNYAGAIKQADAMLAPRLELEKLTPFYCTTKAQYSFLISGESYWGATQRKAHYQKLDDMINGKTGTLVAMSPKAVQFSLDPADIGRFEQWYNADYDRGKWQQCETGKPFYLQVPNGLSKRGIPYMGAMWYVFQLDVPETARGKTIKLYAPIVVDDAWVWVNGTFVTHRGHIEPYTRPAELQADITSLVQPGKTNTIAVRVHTGLCPAASADGFMGKLFLYSPK